MTKFRKSLAELNATGKTTNKWFTWERINGDDLCPTYMYRLVLARLPGGRRLYLHHFVGDDWSLDPHDHPKYFVSIGLWGSYDEDVYYTHYLREPDKLNPLEPVTKHWRAPWVRKFPANHIHRIRSAHTGGAWTLVYTGPVTREWGFWMHNKWIEFREYLRKHSHERKDC